jgi:hypothetical protein
VAPLDEEGAPWLLVVGGTRWAVVPVRMAGRDPADLQVGLESARRAILLGRAWTPWVAVLPHWGTEWDPGSDALQEQLDALFRAWGASLVLGSHAHVRQPSTCRGDSASWLGMGNLLFDQHRGSGSAVTCCPEDGGLSCTERAVLPDPATGFPMIGDEIGRCNITREPADLSWRAHPGRDGFVSVEPFPPAGPEAWLAWSWRPSPFDHETALRPLVFRVSEGRPVDLWRGTALAWPTLAARMVPGEGEARLCAIHRGDSYLRPDPSTRERRREVYRWTGAGFEGVADATAREACQDL